MSKHTPILSIMDRRQCLRTILFVSAGLLSGLSSSAMGKNIMKPSPVVLVKTNDRVDGIATAMSQFDLADFKGASIAIKANYNSADPFPASTHPETLATIIREFKEVGAGPMTLAERSGMGSTAAVLESMGARAICEENDVNLVVMDDLDADDYHAYEPERSHWSRGFLIAHPFVNAEKRVQTCCLKTHQYGGHFTMSLKNIVGAVAKYGPRSHYNYMSELHNSPHQRAMIAEISQIYHNDLIIMDGLEAFVTGGPHVGRKVSPGVIVAGLDPVAVDAVGVAILRIFGTTLEVTRGSIFEQEQIRRAAELGIGARTPEMIDLVPMGEGADAFAALIREQLSIRSHT